MPDYDLILIGGGIVGVATAWQMKQQFPELSVLLVEKEQGTAHHQTGHNSGVIHAGVYYAPGSLKADFCKRGAQLTLDFCRDHGLPYEQCGKLLVATDDVEMERMGALEERCRRNGIGLQRLSDRELKLREPNMTGQGALLVPATGITDYGAVTAVMARRFADLGGHMRLASRVRSLDESSQAVRVEAGGQVLTGRFVIVCGGLQADRLAKMMGLDIDFAIVPFRGEYYRLRARHNRIVKHLIYPIPDPDLPFLGVHLTRMIDGSVTVGPNAVLGAAREGYPKYHLSIKDMLDMAFFRGFWGTVAENWRSGMAEMWDSLYKPGYLKRVQKYCPILTTKDFLPYPAGIRAQAVKNDGSLVHDFLFAHSERSLHVCNAPSPAATSAIPIAQDLCQKAAEAFSL